MVGDARVIARNPEERRDANDWGVVEARNEWCLDLTGSRNYWRIGHGHCLPRGRALASGSW
jgi:hypothetical protein